MTCDTVSLSVFLLKLSNKSWKLWKRRNKAFESCLTLCCCSSPQLLTSNWLTTFFIEFNYPKNFFTHVGLSFVFHTSVFSWAFEDQIHVSRFKVRSEKLSSYSRWWYKQTATCQPLLKRGFKVQDQESVSLQRKPAADDENSHRSNPPSPTITQRPITAGDRDSRKFSLLTVTRRCTPPRQDQVQRLYRNTDRWGWVKRLYFLHICH